MLTDSLSYVTTVSVGMWRWYITIHAPITMCRMDKTIISDICTPVCLRLWLCRKTKTYPRSICVKLGTLIDYSSLQLLNTPPLRSGPFREGTKFSIENFQRTETIETAQNRATIMLVGIDRQHSSCFKDRKIRVTLSHNFSRSNCQLKVTAHRAILYQMRKELAN